MTTNELAKTPSTIPWFSAVACWLAISAGFLGLKVLMHERPQFTGTTLQQPTEMLFQASPRVMMRKVGDDVWAQSEVNPGQSRVQFSLRARQDHRGLRTTQDLSARMEAMHTLRNPHAEACHVLFKAPHPVAVSGEPLRVSGLELTGGPQGERENTASAWFWSGRVEPGQSLELRQAYLAESLSGVRYEIKSGNGEPVASHQVTLTGQNLPAMNVFSGSGRADMKDGTVTWDQKDFLPPNHYVAKLADPRGLFQSLEHLLDMGPVITLLFLATTLGLLYVRKRPTLAQVFTLAAGYALYFPLVLYLSARFAFATALALSFLVPGVLMLNYLRCLHGARAGLLGGVVVLLLFQIFPTLAAFSGWNRGLVLLCLGTVTLFVFIQLQNQALRRGLPMVLVLGLAWAPPSSEAGEIQVLLPAHLATNLPVAHATALVRLGPAKAEVEVGPAHADLRYSLPVLVRQAGPDRRVWCAPDAHLRELSAPEGVFVSRGEKGWELTALAPGEGMLTFTARAALQSAPGRLGLTLPHLPGIPVEYQIRADLGDLVVEEASIWSTKTEVDGGRLWEIGVTGEAPARLSWSAATGSKPETNRVNGAALESLPWHGLAVLSSRHLTLINTDGTCTHVAHLVLPAKADKPLTLELPEGSTPIRGSLDGVEMEPGQLRGRELRITPPPRPGTNPADHRLELHLACAPVELGFLGLLALRAPEPSGVTGTLDWTIAFPPGFEVRVLSSGLNEQPDPRPLSEYGSLGEALRDHEMVSLNRAMVPAQALELRVKYVQRLPGFNEELDPPGK